MNQSLPAISRRTAGPCARQRGKLNPQLAGCMAFGAAVLVSIVLAATVASHDIALTLGGF